MSTILAGEENVQWDLFTNLLGQSTGNIHDSCLDWTPLELDGLGEESIQYATSLPPSESQILQRTSRIPDETPKPETAEQSPESKAKKSKKGSKKSGHDEQSAVERRRAQVRQAQQAYRNREKATITSLRRDVNDLKNRLIEMENISDELFEMISSCSALPEQTKMALQRLHKKEEQYRLPLEMRTASIETAGTTHVSDKADTYPSLPRLSLGSHRTSNALEAINSHLRDEYTRTQESQSRSIIDQPSQLFEIYQSLHNPRPNLCLSMAELGHLYESPLAFSIHLRRETLRGAYSLIANPDTPYHLLCKKFRHCIFSSTRDDIIRRLDFLIGTPTKMASAIPSIDATLDKTFLFSGNSVTTEPSLKDIEDPYIQPEGLDDVLSKRGLAIRPGSPFAEFSATPENLSGPTTTVFDEVRQKEKISVSVSKLFQELLSRMVCLGVGPGILTSKIDEAIRSALLASF